MGFSVTTIPTSILDAICSHARGSESTGCWSEADGAAVGGLRGGTVSGTVEIEWSFADRSSGRSHWIPRGLPGKPADGEDLDAVIIASSTLTVQLTDDANDFVIADAVRIERIVI